MTDAETHEPLAQILLRFANKLQEARTFSELLIVADKEVRATIGYKHVWFLLAADDDATALRTLEVSGPHREQLLEVGEAMPVQGDPFLEELTRSVAPVVVADARTDPRTNKTLVAKVGNRTIVHLPLGLVDSPVGLLGMGTFGEEGCRPPTEAQLDYLSGMGSQIAVVAGRIRFASAKDKTERQRKELERRLDLAQRLESLGMLAGGIAHDFNNLLTVIVASASLAKQDSVTPQVRAELGNVLTAAAQAKDMTAQLLAMSRSQPLEIRNMDLGERLQALVALSKRLLPETISFSFEPAVGSHIIEGDASQLDRVFLNLLINSRDAMPEGGRITIGLSRQRVAADEASLRSNSTPGEYLVVRLSDTGVGMTEEVQERIFEPFFTTKGSRVGTGLGLAASYGIIHQHGGMIRCKSEPGVGTTFSLYFPVSHAEVQPLTFQSESHPPEGGTEHILVVEDDPPLRRVAVRMLKRAGYRTHAVSNGDDACKVVSQGQFDLVLMDVVMPGMSCCEAVSRMQELRPSMPIMLTSGYSGSVNIRELVQRTGLPLLQKPYEPDALLRLIRRALEHDESSAVRRLSIPTACSLVSLTG